MKRNNIMLLDKLESKILKYVQYTKNIENAATFYKLASFINILTFSKEIRCYVYRCFTMIAETKSFLTLDFCVIAKILSSSQINTISELQVFKAADNWLNYNFLERSKYAKELLYKVRLPLLSDHDLDSVLCKDSSFRNNEECLVMVKNILKDKDFVRNSKNFSSTTRYCNQNMFNILTFDEGNSCCPKLLQYDISNKELGIVKDFPQLSLHPTYYPKYSRAVFLNGDFYVFCCINNYRNNRMSVQKYSLRSNIWKVVGKDLNFFIDSFAVCVFMGKVYLIGGTTSYVERMMGKCFEFNPVSRNIQQVKEMNAPRRAAACTVFEGKMVVSGGNSGVTGRTVEVYDHVTDKWSYMPNMIEGRIYHDLVAIKNKLFAFGGVKDTCEVYDSCSKKFSLLKSPPNLFTSLTQMSYYNAAGAISIGNKIIVFNIGRGIVASYDIKTEQWSEKLIKISPVYKFRNCFKVPQF